MWYFITNLERWLLCTEAAWGVRSLIWPLVWYQWTFFCELQRG